MTAFFLNIANAKEYNKEEYVYQSCITQEIATEKIIQGCANP